jgi:hypothetical protein
VHSGDMVEKFFQPPASDFPFFLFFSLVCEIFVDGV